MFDGVLLILGFGVVKMLHQAGFVGLGFAVVVVVVVVVVVG